MNQNTSLFICSLWCQPISTMNAQSEFFEWNEYDIILNLEYMEWCVHTIQWTMKSNWWTNCFLFPKMS